MTASIQSMIDQLITVTNPYMNEWDIYRSIWLTDTIFRSQDAQLSKYTHNETFIIKDCVFKLKE